MYIGVDIGGTNTEVGLVSQDGKIIDREVVKTSRFELAKDLVLAIAESIYRMQKVRGGKIEGIGIGCPNGNALDGTMQEPANLPYKGVSPIVDYFKEYFENIPIKLTNDANAAAVGEMVYGKAKGLKDFVEITLGTGLGSGFVVNGQLVNGANGMAGEIGHVVVERGGRLCGCGARGCLERYVSASGVVATYNELSKEHRHEFEASNFKDICALVDKGEHIAIECFERTGEVLGRALAAVAMCMAPSHIFLFGGLARAGESLLKPLRFYFEENLLRSYRNSIKIEISGLLDTNAAVLGAASLCMI